MGDNLVDIAWNKIAALTGGTNEWPLGLGLRPWYLQVSNQHNEVKHLRALWCACTVDCCQGRSALKHEYNACRASRRSMVRALCQTARSPRG